MTLAKTVEMRWTLTHKRENLVVLRFGPNPCLPEVIDIDQISEVTVDLKAATWTYRENDRLRKIGESRIFGPSYGQSGEVIGVYDKTITDHINFLARVTKEVFDRRPGGED